MKMPLQCHCSWIPYLGKSTERERECVSIEQCKSHAYSAIPQGIARGVYYELVVATILVGLE